MNMGIIILGVLTLGVGLILLFFVGFMYRRIPYCNTCRKRIQDKKFLSAYKRLRTRS